MAVAEQELLQAVPGGVVVLPAEEIGNESCCGPGPADSGHRLQSRFKVSGSRRASGLHPARSHKLS